MPPWALLCYKELIAGADPEYKPSVLAYQCDDAILIHPEPHEKTWVGLLVALEDASEQERTLVNEYGNEIKVWIPKINTKVIAEENIALLAS